MSPKEKAEELIAKYCVLGKLTFISPIDSMLEEGYLTRKSAIKCAIICVKEILNVLFQHHEIDYWKDVLIELKSMQ